MAINAHPAERPERDPADYWRHARDSRVTRRAVCVFPVTDVSFSRPSVMDISSSP